MHLVKSDGEIPQGIEKVTRDDVALDILKWAKETKNPDVIWFAFVVSRRIRKVLVAE
jgi:hypothetical protein